MVCTVPWRLRGGRDGSGLSNFLVVRLVFLVRGRSLSAQRHVLGTRRLFEFALRRPGSPDRSVPRQRIWTLRRLVRRFS